MNDDAITGAIPTTPRYVPLAATEDEAKALERIRLELNADPPKKAIKSKDGYDYLHSYYVFARANVVFGALNVGYLHRLTRVLFTGKITTRSGEREYVVCEATAGVIIALPGDRVFYTEGTATCDGMGKGYGDAFNIAQKGAYSDARKIALRPLGPTFGSDFSIDDAALRALDDRVEIEGTAQHAAKPEPHRARPESDPGEPTAERDNHRTKPAEDDARLPSETKPAKAIGPKTLFARVAASLEWTTEDIRKWIAENFAGRTTDDMTRDEWIEAHRLICKIEADAQPPDEPASDLPFDRKPAKE